MLIGFCVKSGTFCARALQQQIVSVNCEWIMWIISVKSHNTSAIAILSDVKQRQYRRKKLNVAWGSRTDKDNAQMHMQISKRDAYSDGCRYVSESISSSYWTRQESYEEQRMFYAANLSKRKKAENAHADNGFCDKAEIIKPFRKHTHTHMYSEQ